MVKIKLTRDEVKQFLNDIFYYEVTMMIYARGFWVSNNKRIPPTKEAIEMQKFYRSMAIETMVTHGRILLEFFYYPSNERIRVWDFFPDWISAEKTGSIKALERRVNEEVSHLDASRLKVKPEEKGWDFGFVNDFGKLAKQFINRFDESYDDERLKELRQLLSEIIK